MCSVSNSYNPSEDRPAQLSSQHHTYLCSRSTVAQRWLRAHHFIPQDSVSYYKVAVTCSAPTQGGDEMLFLSLLKICAIVESALSVFSVPLSEFSKLAKHSKTSHRNNKMQSCQIKLANQSQCLSGLEIGFGFVFLFFTRLFGWAFPFGSRSWFGLHHATSLEVLSEACPLQIEQSEILVHSICSFLM